MRTLQMVRDGYANKASLQTLENMKQLGKELRLGMDKDLAAGFNKAFEEQNGSKKA